ncbi:MAG: sporulation protein [Polyangiaceae bacterium]|nr:sporulation protein [Polyangiaceae bacterium]
MEIEEVLNHAQDVMSAGRVFGPPVERDGTTLVPAVTLRGGLGGGRGEQPDKNRGAGAGFGLVAKPAGAYVIRGGSVTWQPAIDANRVLLLSAALGAAALLALGRLATATVNRGSRWRPRRMRWLGGLRRAFARVE